eukprot:UN22348
MGAMCGTENYWARKEVNCENSCDDQNEEGLVSTAKSQNTETAQNTVNVSQLENIIDDTLFKSVDVSKVEIQNDPILNEENLKDKDKPEVNDEISKVEIENDPSLNEENLKDKDKSDVNDENSKVEIENDPIAINEENLKDKSDVNNVENSVVSKTTQNHSDLDNAERPSSDKETQEFESNKTKK